MWSDNLDKILAFLPSVGIAIGWIWRERRFRLRTEKHDALTEADRERAYSERMEKRLRDKEKELEYALTQLMELKLNNSPDPEAVLKEIIDNDPGLMFAKKRVAPNRYVMLRVSRGYAALYLGGPKEFYDNKEDYEVWGTELGGLFNVADEEVYKTQLGIHVEEKIISPLTGIKGTFKGRKFPVRIGDTVYIIGIGHHANRYD